MSLPSTAGSSSTVTAGNKGGGIGTGCYGDDDYDDDATERKPLLSKSNESTSTSTQPNSIRDETHVAGTGGGLRALMDSKPSVPPSKVRVPVAVASNTVNPRSISSSFLKKYGTALYDWSDVVSLTAVPFSNSAGLSEAVLYHAVLEIKTPTSSTKDIFLVRNKTSSFNEKNAKGTAGSAPHGQTGLTSSATKRMRGVLAKVGLSHCRSPSDGSSQPHPHPPSVCVLKHYDTSNVTTPTIAFRVARVLTKLTSEHMAKNEVFFYSSVQPMLFADMLALEGTGRDEGSRTSSCEGGISTRGILSVPTVLRPNRHKGCCLYTAPMLFLAHKDRGEPGLLRYVCCRSGSGSVTTIGLEDLNQHGFSFNHVKDDGLYDPVAVRSALLAMATFHSSCWCRFDAAVEPAGSKRASTSTPSAYSPSSVSSGAGGGGGGFPTGVVNESIYVMPSFDLWHPTDERLKSPPASSIARFIHRFGKKAVERMHNNNDLTVCVPSLSELFRRWQDYWPVLGHTEVQRALRKVYTNWPKIRAAASQIILTNQTILHGDFHHKNIGFRRSTLHSTRSTKMFRESSMQQGNEESEFMTEPLPPSQATVDERDEGREDTELQWLDVCAFDFQACGTGHVAHEIMYFVCCSLPVDVYLESTTGSALTSSLYPPPPPGASCSNESVSSGGSMTPGGKKNKQQKSPKKAPGTPDRRAERAKREHQFSLPELRELDSAIMREYHSYLSEGVQAQYPLVSLVRDCHILLQHWAGCLLMDMAASSVDERLKLKANPGLKDLLEWAEKTATRVMWSVTAIIATGGGLGRTASSGSTSGSVDSIMISGASVGPTSSNDRDLNLNTPLSAPLRPTDVNVNAETPPLPPPGAGVPRDASQEETSVVVPEPRILVVEKQEKDA